MRDASRRSGWLCGSYAGRKRCRSGSRPGPVEVEPGRKSGPPNKTRRSGETASSRRRTIDPPDRSKQDPAPGVCGCSAARHELVRKTRSPRARAVFGRLGRQASARLRRGHGRPEASPRRAGPPGPGVRWGTTSRALRGHSGTGVAPDWRLEATRQASSLRAQRRDGDHGRRRQLQPREAAATRGVGWSLKGQWVSVLGSGSSTNTSTAMSRSMCVRSPSSKSSRPWMSPTT